MQTSKIFDSEMWDTIRKLASNRNFIAIKVLSDIPISSTEYRILMGLIEEELDKSTKL